MFFSDKGFQSKCDISRLKAGSEVVLFIYDMLFQAKIVAVNRTSYKVEYMGGQLVVPKENHLVHKGNAALLLKIDYPNIQERRIISKEISTRLKQNYLTA